MGREWLLVLAVVFLGGGVDSVKAQSNYATPYTISTFAGSVDSPGNTNDNGTAAQFHQPYGITLDTNGNLYVADNNNFSIRKITSTGMVTTLTGLSGAAGPSGITIDNSGNLYVTDGTTIYKITSVGGVTTFATGFINANGVAVDTSGNLYVTDSSNETISKITSGGVVTTLAGFPGVAGSNDGTGTTGNNPALFNNPQGIAVDASDNLYVADANNSTIRKITPAGMVTTFAGTAGSPGPFGNAQSSNDGTGSAAQFCYPYGITIDSNGDLYVADSGNMTIRKITPAAVVTTLAGGVRNDGSTDGTGRTALFFTPYGITVDASDNIYVCDTANETIRKGTPPVIPPTATIGAVTNITATGAQLNGTVNAVDATTTVVFQYGTDGVHFPNQVSATPGSITGVIDTPVSATLTGLINGTTYYYQISATSGVGTTLSSVGSFVPFTNPSATIGAATAVSTTSFQVSGTYNAQGVSTQLYFDYGTDPTMAVYTKFPASPTSAAGYANTPATAVLPNLAQATTYYYQLVNAAGTVTSTVGSFQTDLLSGLLRQFPSATPSANGILLVSLSPSITPSPGWNFVGEQLWRASGSFVTGLVTGNNYNIEYQPAPGYIQPPPETISITSGGNFITREYLPTPAGATGALNVVLEPANLANTSWSFYGQGQTYTSGTTISGLAPGNYLIQCATVPGYTTPPPTSVNVPSSPNTQVTLTYYAANTSQATTTPAVLPFSTVTDQTTQGQEMPYAFVGQIRNDLGSATGFVVKDRVVATAGHVVYDAGSMSYVTGLQWLFQRYAGTYESVPQIPQGVYVMSGYAAQRATDPNPAISSTTSQNLDVAALYFLSSAGGGGSGYSGYLASDSSPNEFLTSSNNKILVGYPIDGEPAANQGQMWATTPVTAAFTQDSGKDTSTGTITSGTNLQVYTTTALTSVGGNSGGPLCVQYNGSNTAYDGIYYPAAIYLGGSGNQTSVRAIDSNVIALFNNAEIGANAGANNLSAGISQFNTGLSGSNFTYASLQVYFQPGGASGAHWALSSVDLAPGYYSNNGDTRSNLGPGTVELYVTPVNGFAAPPAYYPITLTGGQLSTVTVTYQTLVTQPQSVSFTSATTIPIVTSSYSISGASLNLTLNYAPTLGTVLTVIQNTGGSAISGTFTNLPNNGTINATYNGATYTFKANYAGGSSGDNLTLTLTSILPAPADTPTMPAWALALLAMLLFIASSRFLPTSRET